MRYIGLYSALTDKVMAMTTKIPSERKRATAAKYLSPSPQIFAKYAAVLIGLITFALLKKGYSILQFSYNEVTVTMRLQHERAGEAADRIAEFVHEIEKALGWTSSSVWDHMPLEERRFDFIRLPEQEPSIHGLAQLDGLGHEQLKLSLTAPDVVGSGTDYSLDPRFVEARAKGVWFGATLSVTASPPR